MGEGILHATVTARGGAGGAGAGNSSGVAGAAASVSSDITGNISVSTNSKAYAGAGGAASGTGNGGAGGDATGSAAVASTSTNYTNQVFNSGALGLYGGAGGSASAGNGGAGGTAIGGAAMATIPRDGDTASVTEVGGQGGQGSGAGHSGGAGGVASGAYAHSIGGNNSNADVTQRGGAGGAGASGANGGAGAASTLTNAVNPQDTGGLSAFYQTAIGGAGGASAGGTAGAGGAAGSYETYNTSANPMPPAYIHAHVTATGGVGGAGSAGSAGGAGGQANATLIFTGGDNITSNVTATAGASGGGTAAGAGGLANAMLTVTGGSNMNATSTAQGGAGVTTAGHAKAKTLVTGTAGAFSATSGASLQTGQLIQSGSAKAADTVDGFQSAKTKVVIGPAALGFNTTAQALATQNAAPDAATTAPVLAANANIAAAFGASPSFFAIDELGGSYAKSGGTTSETTTDTINLTVDLTKLASRQDLVAGFYGATGLGTGFSSLTFTVTADGIATPLVTRTFTTLLSAETFFTDKAKDLGSLATGALSGNTLTLQATFTLTTTTPGQGFFAQMIIGDPPSTAPPVSRFAQAIAGLGGASGGSPINTGQLQTWVQALLSAPSARPIA